MTPTLSLRAVLAEADTSIGGTFSLKLGPGQSHFNVRVVVGAIALFTFGPAYFRHTLSAIFVISRDVEAAAPYKIEVQPGDAAGPGRHRPAVPRPGPSRHRRGGSTAARRRRARARLVRHRQRARRPEGARAAAAARHG